jgi:hypothetical protein
MGETLKARIHLAQILVLPMALQALAGCVSPSGYHVDVSSPSHQEFVEFDETVNVALPLAYQNILRQAPACWRTPFSGQITARHDPAGYAPSQISFVVPGKFVGSKVPLASVRLYPQDDHRTRLVGVSFAYPGTWQLAKLAGSASALTDACKDDLPAIASATR